MSWVDCVCDNDYEINTEYPYNIRRKGSDKIINEHVLKAGYVQCSLNSKIYYKHRIIALQFIPNPDNLEEIDHRDHDRTNNHIENLIWSNRSKNNRNRSGQKGYKYVFLDELPTSAEPLSKYNNHDLTDIFIDRENKKLYLFNTEKYREIMPIKYSSGLRYKVHDSENKWINLYHKILFE
jgi:hypothetical protein